MDRKAFRFYKSYYDVALELNDDDRYQFLMAVIEMEFTGKCRELTGMAKFAFLSQKHSIDLQVRGYLDRTQHPTQGGMQGGIVYPPQQEKEKEKEQEKEKVQVYGKKSNLSFAVKTKYISDTPCKVYDSGFKDYADIHQVGLWFPKPYMVELFWKDWNGKMFNDHSHVNSVMINIINNKNG